VPLYPSVSGLSIERGSILSGKTLNPLDCLPRRRLKTHRPDGYRLRADENGAFPGLRGR
jgi:hypothetical protein